MNPERHLVGLNEAQRAAAQHGVDGTSTRPPPLPELIGQYKYVGSPPREPRRHGADPRRTFGCWRAMTVGPSADRRFPADRCGLLEDGR